MRAAAPSGLMASMPSFKPSFVTAVAAVAFLAVGCGTATIEKAEVERQAAAAVTQEVGQAPDRIVCPDDLEAKVDAKMRCALVAPDQQELDADVRITEVDGEDAKFAVNVGTEVHPAGELTSSMEEGAAEQDDSDKKKKKTKK